MVSFSINNYDKDGDLHDICINLHFNWGTIRLKDIEAVDSLIRDLTNISKEIKETY
jgi:hypothetical protein